MKTKTTKTEKTTKTPAKARKNTPRIPKGPTSYQGAPLQATRLLTRRMSEFKNTTADCWLIINTIAGTYTFANSYKAGNLPPSYRPEKYTYTLTDKTSKKLEKKIEEQGFSEVEVTDYPAWVVPATPTKRKSKK
jgi:hypothetical protein